MHFPLDEYERRIRLVRQEMERSGIELLLLFGQEAMAWTSGYYTPGHFGLAAFALPLSGAPLLVVRLPEKQSALTTSWVPEDLIETYPDDIDAVVALTRALERRGLVRPRIATDKHSWFLTVERYDALCARLPNTRFVSDNQMIDHLRFRKSEVEIETIKEAAGILTAGLSAAIEATRVGASERDIAAAMASARIRAGSDLPVDGVLTTGERVYESHGGWTDRKVRHGDRFRYEFHGIRKNYWARMLRSGFVGEPDDEQERVAELITKAQDAGIAAMRAGVHAKAVDRLCSEPLIEAGLVERATFQRKMGYGLGLNFRPSPGEFLHCFLRDADFVLEAGMVFHMINQVKGVGISDTVVVRENGVEFLTHLPRTLVAR